MKLKGTVAAHVSQLFALMLIVGTYFYPFFTQGDQTLHCFDWLSSRAGDKEMIMALIIVFSWLLVALSFVTIAGHYALKKWRVIFYHINALSTLGLTFSALVVALLYVSKDIDVGGGLKALIAFSALAFLDSLFPLIFKLDLIKKEKNQ